MLGVNNRSFPGHMVFRGLVWTGRGGRKTGLVKLGLLKRLRKKRYDLDQLLLTERHSVNNIAGANNYIGFYYWIIWPVSGENISRSKAGGFGCYYAIFHR